jgi:hypothetical protein
MSDKYQFLSRWIEGEEEHVEERTAKKMEAQTIKTMSE